MEQKLSPNYKDINQMIPAETFNNLDLESIENQSRYLNLIKSISAKFQKLDSEILITGNTISITYSKEFPTHKFIKHIIYTLALNDLDLIQYRVTEFTDSENQYRFIMELQKFYA